MRELNKPVLYYSPSIDITPVVLQELNRGQQLNPGIKDPSGNGPVTNGGGRGAGPAGPVGTNPSGLRSR
jgi:hypothetical protein